jgi:hypothetical protein
MSNFSHQSDLNDKRTTSSSNLSALFKKKNQALEKNSQQDSARANLLPKQRKFSFKGIMGSLVLFLLIIGGVSAMVLTQMSQDVRQQAAGCTYWNGEAATEGSYDNRGGIRQQCVNGLWDYPDDQNTDPAEIIAEQRAEEEKKPKAGCQNWKGETVSHGSYDNRGGIRQQCVNGIWDFPDDGNTDPAEIIEQNREKDTQSCMMWDGRTVGAGTCDDRNGLLQVCKNGLWDAPKGNDCKSPFSSIEDETHQVECELGQTTVYTTSGAVCKSAGELIEKTEDAVEAVIGGIKDIISTFTSVNDEVHDIECNLGGTVTYVAEESVCTDADGVLGGEDTPIFHEKSSADYPVECIVNGVTYYTDTDTTCNTNSGLVDYGECDPNTCIHDYLGGDNRWCGKDGRPTSSLSCDNETACSDGTEDGACNPKGELCIGGDLWMDATCSSDCTPNTCIHNYDDGENRWCGTDGKPTRNLTCDMDVNCGSIPDGDCNDAGQRCVGGSLWGNSNCQPDDLYITAGECEVQLAEAIVASPEMTGECTLGENGFGFTLVLPQKVAPVLTGVSSYNCLQQNRTQIIAGLGRCTDEDGDTGYIYGDYEMKTISCYVGADSCEAESVEVRVDQNCESVGHHRSPQTTCELPPEIFECTSPLSTVFFWEWDWDCHEPATFVCKTTVSGYCSEVTQMGSCPDGYEEGFCPEPEPISIVCHQGYGMDCEQEVFEGSCPLDYDEGVCPNYSPIDPGYSPVGGETSTVTCHEINGGQCFSYQSEYPCGENPYSASLRDGDCPAVIEAISVPCYRIDGQECDQQSFESSCPSRFTEGSCP